VAAALSCTCTSVQFSLSVAGRLVHVLLSSLEDPPAWHPACLPRCAYFLTVLQLGLELPEPQQGRLLDLVPSADGTRAVAALQVCTAGSSWTQMSPSVCC
jgi:hypothetical protein